MKKTTAPKRKRPGRPRIEFDQATADRICEQIGDGKSLRQICLQKAMPTKKTVLRWLEEQPAFAAQYARARDTQAETYFDELVELAKKANADNAQAIRVRADIIKWACSKLKPRKYGDRAALEIIEADVRVQEVGDVELGRLLAFQISREARDLPLDKFIDSQVLVIRNVAEMIAIRGGGSSNPEHHQGDFADVVQMLERAAQHVARRLNDGTLALPAPKSPPQEKSETPPQSEPTTRAREGVVVDAEPPARMHEGIRGWGPVRDDVHYPSREEQGVQPWRGKTAVVRRRP